MKKSSIGVTSYLPLIILLHCQAAERDGEMGRYKEEAVSWFCRQSLAASPVR
jgi:hypothetical protein